MRDVRIGLCGFTMAFADYVREFRVVEVQQTFYEPPRDATLLRWRRDCGSFRTTPIVLGAWERTLECARLLRATAVLLQCPRSFRATPENADRLRAFLSTVVRPEGVRILWEPRGPWPRELVLELCRELELVHVVDPFVDATVTPEQTYLRLHGVTGARHVHTNAELDAVAAALPDAGTAYVMFNNLPRIGDARRFRRLVGGDSPDLD